MNTLRKALAMCLFVSISSCSTTSVSNFISNIGSGRSRPTEEQIKAAQSNDWQRLENSFGGKKLPEESRYRLVAASMYPDKCNSEAVSAILRNNRDSFSFTNSWASPPYEKKFEESAGTILVALASRNLCVDILKKIEPLVRVDEFVKGLSGGFYVDSNYNVNWKGGLSPEGMSRSFVEFFTKEYGSRVHDDANEKELIAIFSETLKIVDSRLVKECRVNNADACAVKKQLAQYVEDSFQEYDNDLRRETYLKSPQALLDQACDSFAEMKDYKAKINEENAKGRVSGYVNVVKLKEWGDRVYMLRKSGDNASAEYKRVTGKRAFQCK